MQTDRNGCPGPGRCIVPSTSEWLADNTAPALVTPEEREAPP
ncbi:hypothetical protein [Cryobacterium sp. M91]|nr:hypothetical protein [Cryobacterium sp. M91]